MRGKKAKALRKMVGYRPAEHRPELAVAMPSWRKQFLDRIGVLQPYDAPVTVVLPKDHPRRAYQFAKQRYGVLPLAQMLTRLRRGLGDGTA